MRVRHAVLGWLRRFFPKKPLGQRGEAAAARYLRRRGYKILARGDRFGPGELDLVALLIDNLYQAFRGVCKCESMANKGYCDSIGERHSPL